MKKIFSLIVAAAFVFPVLAQDSTGAGRRNRKEERKTRINAMSRQEEEGVIKYTKHLVIGGKFTTDGYGGFIEVGRAQSLSKALLFQLDIAERKHPKEEKQSSSYSGSPLIYGKINFFYPVKLGVQQQILLGNKGNKNGVSVTGNFGGGLSLGILRAYEIEVDDADGRKVVTYQSTDSSKFLNAYTDASATGPTLFKGWSSVKLTPGAYLKTSVRFDYGKYNEMVNALEVGLTGEIYSKKIPQMIYQKQKQFFFSAYVALMFGKRK